MFVEQRVGFFSEQATGSIVSHKLQYCPTAFCSRLLKPCVSLKDCSVVCTSNRKSNTSLRSPHSKRRGANARLVTAAISSPAEFNHNGGTSVGRETGRLAALLHSSYDREIAGLFFPAALTLALDPLLGAVDTAIVGRLGATALGAVGMSNMVFGFSLMCFKFLMVVTTPAVAAAVATSKEKVSEATTDGLWVAWACGLPMMFLLWKYAHVIPGALKASPDAIPYCVDYLRARVPAVPIVLSLFVINATYRGVKDTRTPLMSSLLANTINLSMDVLLVFGLGMGVAGAAWATTASQYVSAVFLVYKLVSGKYLLLRGVFKPPRWSRLLPLLKAGMFVTSQSLISTVLLMQSTSFAARLGSPSLAAHEIIRQAFALQYILFAAMELTSQSMVASAVGRGDTRLASCILRRLMTLALVVGSTVAAVLLLCTNLLPAVFTPDTAVQAIAARVIPVVAMGSIIDCMATTMEGALTGSSEYRWVSMQQTVGAIVCFMGLNLNIHVDGGLIGVWICMRLISVCRFVGSLIRLTSGKAAVALRPAASHGVPLSEIRSV